MQLRELGWNAAPPVVAQWQTAGIMLVQQPIEYEGSSVRSVKWVVSLSSTFLQRSWHTCTGTSSLGPTVCGDLHKSVSMTRYPIAIAQSASLREHA